ncbi:Sulfite exporter TauE/SafE [Lactobacillus crispatus]|uniref:sulfite exporter TauE/SafE family protein n=1 Tax=Lactobacillus crispatus TaxID=47770 RepID=UPI0018E3B15F|nr:sulfite exporter TauE/SafE family protein [Lactobacillus crispatus]MBI1721828.1 Sulfite exporter TauE/SafE [Lactobacillus crispatus]
MMKLILFVVGIIASIIGALTGVGGGIVLKTFYDLVNAGGVLAIGFYSTVLVFTMCIVSVLKQIKSGFSFDWPFLISISVGSIFGGYIGNSLLNYAAKYIPENTTKLIQSVILLITLIFLTIFTNKSSKYRQKEANFNWFAAFWLGLFLGAISIFLAIGGGPLNVSLLVIIFHFTMKQSSIYSIATVFFSQITKIISIIATGQFMKFDPVMIPLLMLAGIIGGYIGTVWNQKISSAKLEQLYTYFMIALVLITGFNVYRFI